MGIFSLIGATRRRLLRSTRYQALPQSSDAEVAAKTPRTFMGRQRRLKQFLIAGLFLTLALLGLLVQSPAEYEFSREKPTSTKNNFRLILPAHENTTGLCKAVLSAAALDYPTPLLVNWQSEYKNDKLPSGGAHLTKITGVLNYLRDVESEYDNDLVLVTDGFDVWFQLPPQVLIERYYALTEAANRRIRAHLSARAVELASIYQRVIFSAQKRCWPREASSMECKIVPHSTLPDDAYGEETDKTTEDKEGNALFTKNRPRWINSGSVIGPLKDVRAVFERAYEKAKRDQSLQSEQGIFTDIYGDQEIQRHIIKYRYRNFFQKLGDWVKRKMGTYTSIVDFNTADMDPSKDQRYEFGIYLDHAAQIVHPTVFAEGDAAFIAHDDKEGIEGASKSLGIEPQRIDTNSLPPDLKAAHSPFANDKNSTHLVETKVPADKTWAQVSLLTNMWTGVVPAAIHLNANKDGSKAREATGWKKLWFQPFLRTWLNARATSDQQPVAITHNQGYEQVWTNPFRQWAGVRTDKGSYIRYAALCEGKWKELLSDDKGPWEEPPSIDGETTPPPA